MPKNTHNSLTGDQEREMFKLFDAHFDEETLDWKNPWNDQSIADKVGCDRGFIYRKRTWWFPGSKKRSVSSGKLKDLECENRKLRIVIDHLASNGKGLYNERVRKAALAGHEMAKKVDQFHKSCQFSLNLIDSPNKAATQGVLEFDHHKWDLNGS